MDFVAQYLSETCDVVKALDGSQIDRLANTLARLRDTDGRLFVLGVGGSAGHAAHAAGDFRKQCGIEAYSATDNVCELTARTNDDGWESTFEGWLKGSRLRAGDGLLILSVGGGDKANNVSPNIVKALDLALRRGAAICGIVGRRGGDTAKVGTAVVTIPPLFERHIGPHTEGLMAVVWHLLLNHPALRPGSHGSAAPRQEPGGGFV